MRWPLAMLLSAESSLARHALVHDRGKKGSPHVSPNAATWTTPISLRWPQVSVCQGGQWDTPASRLNWEQA